MKKLMTLAGLMTIAAMAIGTSGCGSSSTPATTPTTPNTLLTYVSHQKANDDYAPTLYSFDPTAGTSAAVSIPINSVAEVREVSSNSTATAVAYRYYSTSDTQDIFYQGTTGSEVQLTTDAEAYEPVFSPDGKTIAYEACNPGPDCYIFTMNVDGTNQQPVYVTDGYGQEYPWWSADGTTLSFYIYLDDDSDVASVNHGGPHGHSALRHHHTGNSKPHGDTTNTPSYSNGLYTMTVSNPSPTLVYATNSWWGPATFTTDGTKLLLTTELSAFWNIYSINLDGSGLTPLTVSLDANDVGAVEYNGQIFFNRYDSADDAWDFYTMSPNGSAQSLALASPTTQYSMLIDSYYWDW